MRTMGDLGNGISLLSQWSYIRNKIVLMLEHYWDTYLHICSTYKTKMGKYRHIYIRCIFHDVNLQYVKDSLRLDCMQ